MSLGLNKIVDIDGETYHIQIEDKEKNKLLEARVYVDGRIIFQKRHSYEKLLTEAKDTETFQCLLQEELKKLFCLISAAIQRGKITK